MLLFSHSVESDSFVTPCAIAHQDPLSMAFSSQEHWSGLPFPSPGDLPDPRIENTFPALALPLCHLGIIINIEGTQKNMTK